MSLESTFERKYVQEAMGVDIVLCIYVLYTCRDVLCACLSAFLYPTNLIQMCIKLFFRCFAIAFFLAKAIMVSNLELR